MKLHSFIGLALGLVLCSVPSAALTAPDVDNVKLLLGTPDSLFVRVQFTPGTVPNPTGPIVTRILWTMNGAGLPLRTVSGTADTLRVGRCDASLGVCSDTVAVNLASVYQDRPGPSVGALAIFPNADTQLPSTPTIVSVDSL